MVVLPLDTVRSRLAHVVIDRLADPAVTERIAGNSGGEQPRSHNTESPWLALDSPVRRVHANAAMLVGGIRSLVLQSLHPVAMQAVEDHSGYRTDPWGRFRSIVSFLYATTFGSTLEASQRIEQVRRIHDLVTGVMPDGTPYRASDPELLMWVHLAEMDSILQAHQAYATPPLSREEADRYIADMALTAEALGVVGAPRSRDQLQTRLAGFRPVLRAGPPAREATRMLVWDPPITGLARAGYRVLAAGAVATIPGWVRSELGLPTLPIADRAVVRPAARTLVINLDRALAADKMWPSRA